MKPPSLTLGDFAITGTPAISTSAPALHPDEAPGAGQARDAALDASALDGAPAPLPAPGPTASDEQAAADIDASIAAARAGRDITISPLDPLDAFRSHR